MKHPLIVILVVLASFGSATELAFGAALDAASVRPPVADARIVLDDAQRTLQRTDADPLALRLERLQARQAVELAERTLAQARFQAQQEIAASYTQTLQADVQLDLAMRARDLAARSLEIARIRFERGSATRLDVQDAVTELARAETNVLSAREGRALAAANLQSLVEVEEPLPEPIPMDPTEVPVPTAEAFEERLAEHPSLVQARHGLDVARVARDLLDPSYAPQAQIDQADVRVERAAEGVEEARRGLELQLEQLVDAVTTSRERIFVEREVVSVARDRAQTEEQRFSAGLVAEIQLDQARLALARSELAALQAEHALWNALFDLQAGIVAPVEGLDAF